MVVDKCCGDAVQMAYYLNGHVVQFNLYWWSGFGWRCIQLRRQFRLDAAGIFSLGLLAA